MLFVSAFWTVDEFTGKLIHSWTLDNFKTLWQGNAYHTIALRTIGIAAAVTVADALLAFPFAYFMARIASPRLRAALFVAVLLPLWSSYLLRVYAWRLILDHDGLLNWTLGKLGLPAANLAYTNVAVWLVFTYIWLPFMIIPVYAALERIPRSTIEASADLGAHGSRTFRSVILPLALPGVVAGSIFTFALTLGDYITPTLVGGAGSQFIGNVVYDSVGVSNNVPFAAAYATIPLAVMGAYLLIAKRLGAFEALYGDAATRVALGVWTGLVVAFLWLPIVIICLYAFNSSNVQSWPIAGLSFKWFSPAIHDPDMQAALELSLKAAAIATTVALVLGLTAGLALNRLHFFGKEMVSFLFVLPIALPGIITGMALNSFFVFWKVNFGLWTIVIGHATFCVVVVYNNVLARLRRTPTSLAEASQDLGAGPWTTFRLVTLPTIATALISGALLAFALSFDEVIVTTFTAGAQNTLPIWIFGNIRLGQTLPETNVVVLLVLAATILPVVLAQRLTRESGILRQE